MIKPSGHIFYEDVYSVKYDVQWETVNGLLDITIIIKQPFIWGEKAEAFIKNNTLFRKGVITVERQILRIYDGGYEIVASGVSQIFDFIQMNFPCGGGPVDNFAHHFNCGLSDEVIFKISDGSHWMDIAEDYVSFAVGDYIPSIWGEIRNNGSIIDQVGPNLLTWTDVWSNDDPPQLLIFLDDVEGFAAIADDEGEITLSWDIPTESGLSIVIERLLDGDWVLVGTFDANDGSTQIGDELPEIIYYYRVKFTNGILFSENYVIDSAAAIYLEGKWLYEEIPSISGLIVDERRGLGDDRPELGGQYHTLNGTNQYETFTLQVPVSAYPFSMFGFGNKSGTALRYAVESNTTISGGVAVFNTALNAFVGVSGLLRIGMRYRVTATILNHVSGVLYFRDGTTNHLIGSSNGTFVIDLTATNMNTYFQTIAASNFQIDNVAVQALGIIDSEGTSLLSYLPDATGFTGTAGTAWKISFDGVTRFPCSESSGTNIYDVIGNVACAITNPASNWTTQDSYFYGLHYGYTLSGAVQIPASATNLGFDANGGVNALTHPAGSWQNLASCEIVAVQEDAVWTFGRDVIGANGFDPWDAATDGVSGLGDITAALNQTTKIGKLRLPKE